MFKKVFFEGLMNFSTDFDIISSNKWFPKNILTIDGINIDLSHFYKFRLKTGTTI